MYDISYIQKEITDFALAIKECVRMIMEGPNGINQKVNKNTLVNSNIYNELDVEARDFQFFYLMVNDYIDYIENGRKKKDGSIFAHTLEIAEWASRKGLPSDNKSVLAYCGSIYWYGIQPRPIMDDAFKALDDYWEGWADTLFEKVSEIITEFFN